MVIALAIDDSLSSVNRTSIVGPTERESCSPRGLACASRAGADGVGAEPVSNRPDGRVPYRTVRVYYMADIVAP